MEPPPEPASAEDEGTGSSGPGLQESDATDEGTSTGTPDGDTSTGTDEVDSSSEGSVEEEGSSTGGCVDGMEELVVAGSFEPWGRRFIVPPPWEVFSGDVTRYQDTEWGELALEVGGTATERSDSWFIGQDLVGPFEAGEVFMFSARLRLLSGDLASPLVQLDGPGYPDSMLRSFVGTTQWESVEATLTLDGPADTISLFLWSTADAQAIAIDDVHLRRACR
ncbi:MAG: hypothetical protein AAF721_22610 [Myxococcota bacterium]